MKVWILTFERPNALNRLINKFGMQGLNSNVLSNSPNLQINKENQQYVEDVVINPINTSESTSWCARGWNSIYIKAFHKDDEVIAIQDDTDISDNFVTWINQVKNSFDFIWGHAGDQFHYIHKNVLRKVGWWDERYNGCYCGDADFLKRVYICYDKSRISVEEYHGWGFHHNHCGVKENIITRANFYRNEIDPDYKNQHVEFEELGVNVKFDIKNQHCTNPVVTMSRKHYFDKWGIELEGDQCCLNSTDAKLSEIDWYPWATKKFNIEVYNYASLDSNV
jgi:hypothetical protein